jgi:hypothetical protein
VFAVDGVTLAKHVHAMMKRRPEKIEHFIRFSLHRIAPRQR